MASTSPATGLQEQQHQASRPLSRRPPSVTPLVLHAEDRVCRKTWPRLPRSRASVPECLPPMPLPRTTADPDESASPAPPHLERLGSTSAFDFWWEQIGSKVMRMLDDADYSVEARARHELLLRRYIIPALGPAPRRHGADDPKPLADSSSYARAANLHCGIPIPRFDSFMCDDATPVELGLTWVNGRPNVRIAIEPLDEEEELLFGNGTLNYRATWRLIHKLEGAGLGDFTLFKKMVAEATTSSVQEAIATKPLGQVAHHNGPQSAIASQFFIGWDLGHDGSAMIKAYAMPNARASELGVSNLTVADAALQAAGLRTCPAWQTLRSYMTGAPNSDLDAGLTSLERPELVILSVDCLDPIAVRAGQVPRLKVYLRYPTSNFGQIVRHLTTGGRCSDAGSPTLWRHVLSRAWQHLFDRDSDTHPEFDSTSALDLTRGTLLYVDFGARRQSEALTSKVYLPVRFAAASDERVADGIERLIHCDDVERGRYAAQIAALTRRSLQNKGIHNYVALGQKKDGRIDVCSYINPQIFTPRSESWQVPFPNWPLAQQHVAPRR
ncbi:aromatic prenyltransferase [Ceraceosorus guamensis]|uniref:Aromatic prenyltransferase n=1 Tax=Ceraceosorus guamensis TaxID=1522189 RepID=A0A316VPA8_9BASI|nr:aromatic prenyltransferase [Ceraceosorus guamensis]PWN39362.1 aromatic prenyltransferase [Ceraceosorus guamensis]